MSAVFYRRAEIRRAAGSKRFRIWGSVLYLDGVPQSGESSHFDASCHPRRRCAISGFTNWRTGWIGGRTWWCTGPVLGERAFHDSRQPGYGVEINRISRSSPSGRPGGDNVRATGRRPVVHGFRAGRGSLAGASRYSFDFGGAAEAFVPGDEPVLSLPANVRGVIPRLLGGLRMAATRRWSHT
jgi:hypothetical protein